MKTMNSAIHYQATPQQQISKKKAFILIASVIAAAGVLVAIIH
jgi:hypothetical protein